MGRKKSKFWSFSSTKSVVGSSYDPYGDSDFSTSSSTGWERSLYGGFERPVWDYPSINLSDEVEVIPGEVPGKYYSEWMREKVVKIFLSKCKNHNFMSDLWINAQTSKVEMGFFMKKQAVAYTVNKNQLEMVFGWVLDRETELAKLFDHYTSVIKDAIIRVVIPEDPRGKEGLSPGVPPPETEEGEDESKGEGSGDSSGGKEPIAAEEGPESIERYIKGGKIDKGISHVARRAIAPVLEKMYKDLPLTKMEDMMLKKYMAAVTKSHMDSLKEIQFGKSSLSTYTKKPEAVTQPESPLETQYTQEEINTSESLIKLLDISFESKSDDIKNLRLGKMDIAKLAEVSAGNFHIYHQTVEDQDTRPFSIVLLGDESGSMGSGGRLSSQYSLMKILFRAFSAIMPQDKIWVYGHSGSTTPELYVYHEPETPTFLTTIDNMLRHSHQQNYDGPIVEFVHQRVRAKTSDRIIFIVLSDGTPGGYDYGSSDDHANYKQIMEKCKRDDFIVCGIMIQINNGTHLYNYSTRVDKMVEMPKKVSNLLNKVVKTEFQ